MSRIAPIYSNRVRYELSQSLAGNLTIREPIGWRDDDNEFVRSKTFHGILTQLTNNLGFTGDGRDFVSRVYAQYGVNAQIRLTKDERNPRTDVWERQYSGFLDLFTYEDFDDTVSVKFISSNLLKTIKSRENEKIELDRLTTFSGLEIPPLDNRKVALSGRDILLQSKLKTSTETPSASIRIEDDSKKTNQDILGIPVEIDFASNVSIQQVPALDLFNDNTRTTTEPQAHVSQLFLADSFVNSTIDLSIKGSMNILINRDLGTVQGTVGKVRLVKYNNSIDYDFLEIIHEQDIGNLSDGANLTIAVDINPTVNMLIGESLSLQVFIKAVLGTPIGQEGWIEYHLTNIDFTVDVQQKSFFDATTSDVLLPHETLERYLKIITDEDNILLSEVLGRTDTVPAYEVDGEASLIGATHGFKIRGFSPGDEEDNRYKPMTSTMKDWYTSYFSTWNLGMGVETVGFTEKIRFEKKTYFYNRNVLINLGKVVDGEFEYIQVNNVKRTVDPSAFNTGLEFGYNKGGEYEEAVGLDEPNGRSTFSTIINGSDNKYVKVSKYRADSYGMEFCRRFQKVDSPTEDTKYDNSIWLLDMKRGVTSTFDQILGGDPEYFEKMPTGIFSPQTAGNLRISPANNRNRHGWWVNAGLTKYPEDFIRYGSSTNNSRLKTQLLGSQEYAENGDIQNKDLEDARMTGDIIEFEFEVDYDLLQIIQGKSVILGSEIPNFYGLVAFKNEKGEIEKGYLQKLSPNGVGRWTLLKYNNSFAVEEIVNQVIFQDENIWVFQDDNEFIFN